LLFKTSMNFDILERFLESNDSTLLWNILEDKVIKENLPEDSDEF